MSKSDIRERRRLAKVATIARREHAAQANEMLTAQSELTDKQSALADLCTAEIDARKATTVADKELVDFIVATEGEKELT